MAKLIVFTEERELVATWIPPDSTVEAGAVTVPVAGPRQTRHEIEVENLQSYLQRKAFSELHRTVKERLQLK